MNISLEEGSVIICPTGQSGCLVQLEGCEACVLLKNLEMWHGTSNRLRLPQDDADLAACPFNVERNVPIKRVTRD